MIKYGYILAIILYLLIILTFIFKFEISYRIVKVRPELVEVRSLTFTEYKSLQKAEQIRFQIFDLTLISSIVFAVFSAAVFYSKKFKPLLFPRIFLWLSAVLAILLFLVNQIHFIPHAPIR